LVNDMKAGKVDWLLILNANPVYTAPVDLHFEEAMSNVKTTAHLGSHLNETAVVTEWHINGAHYLENWSDTRAYDGTATVIQPMIDPLYGGKSAHDVIQSMLDDPDTSPYDAVRKTWQANLGAGDGEHAWRKILHDGMVAGTAFQPKTVSAKAAICLSLRPATPTERSRSSSAPTPTSTTGAMPTSAGCRKYPSRSPACRGTTPR
jgi:hypothetical protein